jgi:glycosyltransferase involved in cell wall biosynthesis
VSASRPTVSVLVLNLNGREFLDSCLASLEAQVYPSDRFEIVVVDNGSTDGSTELLKALHARN